MLINLTDVFTSEGKVKKISTAFEKEFFSCMGNEYPVEDGTEVMLTLTNIGAGEVLIEGNLKAVLEIPCDRCLQSVRVPVTAEFTHRVISPDQEKDTSSEEEEQNFISGYELDVDALVNNEILMNMPVKVLCREDCRGICPVCGRNLNEGECGCDRFVPDPRMAAIKDIFNGNKEV